MPSITTQLPPVPPAEPLFRLSVQQYHAMILVGVLTADDRVELLEGMLLYKMPKNPPHRIAVAKLHRALQSLPLAGWSIQLQEPITLSDGEPEPDVAIIQGLPDDYPNAHPEPKNVPLVIEVADTTLGRDRGIKLSSYARAGIEVYWIVNLNERQIEVYSQPAEEDGQAIYKHRHVVHATDSVAIQMGSQLLGTIRVADVLP